MKKHKLKFVRDGLKMQLLDEDGVDLFQKYDFAKGSHIQIECDGNPTMLRTEIYIEEVVSADKIEIMGTTG